MEQILCASTIVAACALYAAWVLMPSATRRWFVRGLLAAPLPKRLANALSPYATAPTGCACDGCDRSALAKPARNAAHPSSAPGGSGNVSGNGTVNGTGHAAISPIVFHPRRKN